jgi:hypothetical protein
MLLCSNLYLLHEVHIAKSCCSRIYNYVHPTKTTEKEGCVIDHIFCRNHIIKHVTEEKIERRIEVMGRRRRRTKQLLDDLKERRGYCKLE